MSRKNFKDSTAHLDQFFSQPQEVPAAPDIPAKSDASEALATPEIPAKSDTPNEYYRLNLRMEMKYKKYLDQASWEDRKTITKFICDLIQADMETRSK